MSLVHEAWLHTTTRIIVFENREGELHSLGKPEPLRKCAPGGIPCPSCQRDHLHVTDEETIGTRSLHEGRWNSESLKELVETGGNFGAEGGTTGVRIFSFCTIGFTAFPEALDEIPGTIRREEVARYPVYSPVVRGNPSGAFTWHGRKRYENDP
jgi:hypothetical protein